MNKLYPAILFGISMVALSQPIYTMSESIIEVKAESVTANPDNTDILSDLQNIDLSSYTIDATKDNFDIIAITEYGYNTETSYSLYLYVFNESGKNKNIYNFSYSGNRAEMYFYNTNKYGHITMSFVSRTTDNKFIKYKIVVPNASYFESGEEVRSYGFVGIEIAKYTEDHLNRLKDYQIAHKWDFEGPTNELTVHYTSEFEALHLRDITGGVYELGSSSYSDTSKGELYYVYFSVPSQFDGEAYGLYSVHADYYNFDFSNKMSALIDEYDSQFYKAIGDSLSSMVEEADGDAAKLQEVSDIAAQYKQQYSNTQHMIAINVLEPIYTSLGLGHFYVEPSINGDDDDYFVSKGLFLVTNYQSYTEDGPVLSALRDDYIFPISSYNERVQGNRVADALDLETAEAITGQSRHDPGVYNNIHYTNCADGLNDAEFITWDLQAHQNSWWENLFGRVQYNSLEGVSCLEKFDIADATKTNSQISDKYYIDSDDVSNFKSFASQKALELRDTYIFRFYADDFDSWGIKYGDHDKQHGWLIAPWVGFLASKMSVIIDFDVIDLTFCNSSKELKNIPVVGNPINISPDISNPSVEFEEPYWLTLLKRILMIILIIIIVLIIIWLIIKIFKFSNAIQTRKANRKILKQSKKKKRRKY